MSHSGSASTGKKKMNSFPAIGQRVKSTRKFTGVPEGTEGMCDDLYEDGCTIAWDLPDRPLPKNWFWDIEDMSKWAINPGVPLSDGFSKADLMYLELVEHQTQPA